MTDLFGADPAPAPRPAKKTAAPAPRKPTKRELREAAPAPRNRAPAKPQAPAESEDAELHGLVRLLAGADMLAPEELEKYSDVVEPVIGKSSRDEMRKWREDHAGNQNRI